MRPLTLLPLFAGLGLGALSAATPGCAEDCSTVTEYTECTSTPGLRYVACPDTYEFNDGSHYTNAGRASDYCYCGSAQVECTDGRMASLCNFTPFDGTAALVYDDNTGSSLTNGVAKCLGYESCTLQTGLCSYQGWYLRCEGPQGTRYVTSTGKVKSEESTAILSCNPGGGDLGDSGDPTAATAATAGSTYRCEAAVTSCDQLDDCSASEACYDASDFFYCANSVDCEIHADITGCVADLACKWELQ